VPSTFKQVCARGSTKLLRVIGGGLLAVWAAGAQPRLEGKTADYPQFEAGWTPRSQFLMRPNTAMEYTNYGWESYRERGTGFGWLPAYDQLGESWLSGSYNVFSWVEDRTRAPQFGSNLIKSLGRHNNLTIARESYGNTMLRLSVGEAFHTTFTSLTLDMPRFTGVRADAVFGRDHELTVLLSRPSDPRYRMRLNSLGASLRNQGTLLGGGHWEGRFLQGGLFLGATFVNHHRFDSLQESGDFLKGTMSVDLKPDTVAVRVTDDSPAGGQQGGAAYDSRMSMTLRRGGATENQVVQGIRPVLVASEGARWAQDHWEVEGPAYVEYQLPVPGDAVGVQTSSTVAQDYRIGMRQTHRALNRTSVQTEIRQTPLVTRGRSTGDGSDSPQRVALDYGLSSAMSQAGIDGRLALGELDLEWEYARSVQYFQYPEEQIGTRSSYVGEAYFVRGTQAWWKLLLGGEFFSVNPRYSSYALDNRDFRKGDSWIQNTQDYTSLEYMGNDFGFYFNEPQPNFYKGGADKRNSAYALVEDNDDGDQYEDQGLNDVPTVERSQPNESGVYPGWDLDQDGVPDYNRNRNSVPDYLEPFFKYEQEEQVFYWGDDFNNNGVLDYFEDDSLPDYPYDKDERGLHFFADWTTPLRGLSFRVGRYRIDQIAGSGRNHVDYVSGSYRRLFPGRARLQWEHQLKRVEDDIANPVFQYRLIQQMADVEGDYESVFLDDPLAMRRSAVNRGYVGTQWTPVRNLTLHNNLRYELNDQQRHALAGGTAQEAESHSTWALVNKADYTLKYWRFTVRPMFKHTLLKQDFGGAGGGPGGLSERRDITETTPSCRIDCRFTDRTSFELGAEGAPFLTERYLDHRDEQRDFSSQTYMGQLKRKGVSGGFNVFFLMGLQYTKKAYDEPALPSETFIRSFFQVFIGEQILAAAQ
jgi:hypothetical protein